MGESVRTGQGDLPDGCAIVGCDGMRVEIVAGVESAGNCDVDYSGVDRAGMRQEWVSNAEVLRNHDHRMNREEPILCDRLKAADSA